MKPIHGRICMAVMLGLALFASRAQAAFEKAASEQGILLSVQEAQPRLGVQPEPQTSALGFPIETSAELIAQAESSHEESRSESSGSNKGSSAPTLAQIQQLRQGLLIQPPLFPAAQAVLPGSNLGSPSAYGASNGQAFATLSYASQPLNASKADGSSTFGFGLGDPIHAVGVEVDVAIISLANSFADAGAAGFKVHKVFPQAGNLGVAAGWSNPIKWGDAQSAEETVYGVVSKGFRLRPRQENELPLTVSLGVGTGAFRSKGAIKAGENAPNVFASAGLQVIPELSLISNWTGNQLNLGVSAAPLRRLPLVFSVGASDVTNNTDGGTRFLFNVGYSLRF